MKGVKARLHKGALFGATAIGIAMSWTQALGQSTPDEIIPVPEPNLLGLYAAIAVGVLAYKGFKRKD